MGNTSCCCSSSLSQEDYQNVIDKLVAVEEMSDIDELIFHIDQLLNAIDQGNVNSIAGLAKTNRVASSINSGGGLLENVLKSSRHICKRNIMPNINRETRKLVIDVTNQMTKIKWLGVALSVVGFVLERIEQVSSNRDDCIELLRYMRNLAKYIKQLEAHLSQEKLNRVLKFIVEGSLMCISTMQSNELFKFFAAPVAADDLQRFIAQLGHEYSELSVEMIIENLNRTAEILNRIPVVLPPSQGRFPSQAAGIEEARNRVTELLDMKRESVKVVVVYGQGGIGKTTLATAVFSKLDLTNYKYCRVDILQHCSEADLKRLQQQILGDLYDRKIKLRSLNEGREELSKDFQKPSSRPVFIFIDNALRQSDLEKLLPISDLPSLPKQSRILVTARNLNETRILVQETIEHCSYQVASLPEEEARKLLCMLALGSYQDRFDPTIDIKGLLGICRGVPLVLKLVGTRLREKAQNVPACRETVEYLKSELLKGEKDEISECMVDFIFNRLEASCKEAFLDIVFFFCNWERLKVASCVGETEFQELERAALVNITDEGEVNVHDIVQARGRMLSTNGERITDLESLTDVLQDEQRIKKTKGIVLKESFELEARHLNLMKRCLRVLILGRRSRIVNGECKRAFDNLRLLDLDIDNYSLMDVSQYPRLAVVILMSNAESQFCEFPGTSSSLKYMYIQDATLVNFSTAIFQFQSLRFLTLSRCGEFDSLPETIRNLRALEELSLKSCFSLVSLPDSFGNLSSLNRLDLESSSSLVSLPDSFGKLSSLNRLDLESCSSLVSLPDSFGKLFSLNRLDLASCYSLVSLPDSFGNLSSLNELYLGSCSSLVSLPDSFGNLSTLNELNLESCSSLLSLPDSFGKLSSLNRLDLESCSSLVSLPDSFGKLYSLNRLDLESCSSLVSLPDSFGKLSSLNRLDLKSCSSLVSLPDSFGNLSSLNRLDLESCSSLESLPDSFGNLSSLNELYLESCSSLVSLPDSFGKLFSFNGLNLDSCSSLVSLPDSFGKLSSLNRLYLRSCSSLVSLPDSFGNLSSLNELYLHACSNLVSLSDSFGNLSSLNELYLDSCSSLVSLPDSFGNLSSLNNLDLRYCSSLESLPDSFGNLSSLNELYLSSCSSLESLPDSFGNLSSLNTLYLQSFSSLVSLPDSFGKLSSLNRLNLDSCSSLVSLPDSFGNLSLDDLDLSSCSSLVSLPDSFDNLSSLDRLDLDSCSSLVSLPDSFGNLFGLRSLCLSRCTQLSVLPDSFGNLASLRLLGLENCDKLSSLPQNFGQLKCLKYVSIHGCRVLQSLSGDFESLSLLIAIKASECSQLEENTMDKLGKMKGLMYADIDGSPLLEKRWEQVKEQYSLAVVLFGRKKGRRKMYPYADVMCRAFFHGESKFVHVDENGQLGELPCPEDGVKLWLLLKAGDVTSTSNSRCWEAAKKKWTEMVAKEGGQMMYVDMGGSWEEREIRVTRALPHLPGGTRAWIAPDNRARLLFADSVRNYYLRNYAPISIYKWGVWNCIVSTSVCVDEEGRRRLDELKFIHPNLNQIAESEYEDISDQLLPVLEAWQFLKSQIPMY